MSGHVALCRPLPEGVVTWFVTGSNPEVSFVDAASRRHALIGRAFITARKCGADEEHRELAGAPEAVMFASKPQLADVYWNTQSLEIRAAFVAGNEVYGGRQLRRDIRQRGMGYVMAVHANHVITADSGRTVTAAGAFSMIPARVWHRIRSGSGETGGCTGQSGAAATSTAPPGPPTLECLYRDNTAITTNYSCRNSSGRVKRRVSGQVTKKR